MEDHYSMPESKIMQTANKTMSDFYYSLVPSVIRSFFACFMLRDVCSLTFFNGVYYSHGRFMHAIFTIARFFLARKIKGI